MFSLMKHLIYFLPTIVVYNLVKDFNSIGLFSIANNVDYESTMDLNEFKKLDKSAKLNCIQNYINCTPKLKWVDENFLSLVSLIATVLFGTIGVFHTPIKQHTS